MGDGKLYQVYVLQNPRGKYYIGLNENVRLRLDQNNRSTLSKFISGARIVSDLKSMPWVGNGIGTEP